MMTDNGDQSFIRVKYGGKCLDINIIKSDRSFI